MVAMDGLSFIGIKKEKPRDLLGFLFNYIFLDIEFIKFLS